MHDTVIAPGGTDLDVDVRNLTRVELSLIHISEPTRP